MVRFEHANLVVREIRPTQEFLLTAFPHWRIRGSGKGRWGEVQRHWVHLGDDDYYVTLNDAAEGDIRDLDGIQPGLAHLGWEVDNLTALIARLESKGYEIDILGREHPYRQSVYYRDPAGFQFEFIEYASDMPDERNMYGGERGELQTDVKNKPVFCESQYEQARIKAEQLYQAVDNKDLDYLDAVLAESVRFQLGSFPVLESKAEVLEANRDFFVSISSMQHTLERVWLQGHEIICTGKVDYVRLDQTEIQVGFATILGYQDDLIVDYQVFVDVSEL